MMNTFYITIYMYACKDFLRYFKPEKIAPFFLRQNRKERLFCDFFIKTEITTGIPQINPYSNTVHPYSE
jgi:hypothetical protein